MVELLLPEADHTVILLMGQPVYFLEAVCVSNMTRITLQSNMLLWVIKISYLAIKRLTVVTIMKSADL